MRELVFNITDEHDGKQAYHYLRYCCNFSYALIVKMRHTENSLLLDGVPIRTIDRIKSGSVLKAYIPEGESYFTPNPDLKIDMLYEVFMHSSLPQYSKDALGEKVAEMKKSISLGE